MSWFRDLPGRGLGDTIIPFSFWSRLAVLAIQCVHWNSWIFRMLQLLWRIVNIWIRSLRDAITNFSFSWLSISWLSRSVKSSSIIPKASRTLSFIRSSIFEAYYFSLSRFASSGDSPIASSAWFIVGNTTAFLSNTAKGSGSSNSGSCQVDLCSSVNEDDIRLRKTFRCGQCNVNFLKNLRR